MPDRVGAWEIKGGGDSIQWCNLSMAISMARFCEGNQKNKAFKHE